MFVAVALPATIFFALQLLLLLGNSQLHGRVLVFAFALAVWFLVALPRLGRHLLRRHLLRRRPHRRAALFRAAWELGIYLLMLGAMGWLVGA